MNENIDLIKILKGCPKGTKLYSPFIGDVKFDSIVGKFIYVTTIYGNLEVFDKQGMYGHYDGECMLLPSKKERDWTKFVRFWNREEKVVTLLDGTKKFDPTTFEPFDKVLARDSSSEVWLPDFFYSSSPYIPIQCFGASWQQCIPYNEETKHLVGTKEDCPEYYKWWEV